MSVNPLMTLCDCSLLLYYSHDHLPSSECQSQLNALIPFLVSAYIQLLTMNQPLCFHADECSAVHLVHLCDCSPLL